MKSFKQNEGVGKRCLQFRRTKRRATLSRLSKHRSRLSKEGYKRDIPWGKGYKWISAILWNSDSQTLSDTTSHVLGIPHCPPDPFSPTVYPALYLERLINHNSQEFLLFSLSSGFPFGEVSAWNQSTGRKTMKTRFIPQAPAHHAVCQWFDSSPVELSLQDSLSPTALVPTQLRTEFAPFAHGGLRVVSDSLCSWLANVSPSLIGSHKPACHFVICELPLGVWQLFSTGP